MPVEADRDDDTINWGLISRRGLLLAATTGAIGLLTKINHPSLPEPRTIPLSVDAAPQDPNLPPGIQPLEQSQRQAAESSLRTIRRLLRDNLAETIYTEENDLTLEGVTKDDNTTFTSWIRDHMQRDPNTFKEYWQFLLGPNLNYDTQIEYDYPGQSILHQIPKTHIQVNREPSTAIQSSIDLLRNSIKLPTDLQLRFNLNSKMTVLFGTTNGLRAYRAYVTERHVGVLFEGPVISAPKIEDPFDIPDIVPQGLPGAFTKG
jgi:hypothetical protein